ncbi:MAG: pyridoxamine 5'-phosphate oxidase family protein [Defluviitaleaceae bacterium]|nr:pyridoxamine 5'-phosphate oxidase family protein [Defluviitaleaceae bacterium]
MTPDAIKRANELITTMAANGGGHAAFCTIDENGFPSASTFSIAKAGGIDELYFATGVEGRPYADRLSKNNKACVCINSDTYTLNLVGTVEMLTDLETKQAVWHPQWVAHWTGPEDPQMLVLRFKTARYTIFFADNEDYAAGDF